MWRFSHVFFLLLLSVTKQLKLYVRSVRHFCAENAYTQKHLICMNRPLTLKIMPTRIMYTDRLNYLCNIKVKNKNCTYLCCCCCDAHTIYQAKEHCEKYNFCGKFKTHQWWWWCWWEWVFKWVCCTSQMGKITV